MPAEPRGVIPMLVLAAMSLAASGATGVDWLGQPLRLVHLLTILGLGMSAGVAWAEALARHRGARGGLAAR